MVDTSKVTRVEVIDWTKEFDCRAYVFGPKEGIEVAAQLQDDGRTLKIFIKEKP